MIDSPLRPQKFDNQPELCKDISNNLPLQARQSPLKRANFILKPPPQSQSNLDFLDWKPQIIKLQDQFLEFNKAVSIFEKCQQKPDNFEQSFCSQIKQLGQDHRVKGKLNKKGKRDGQNIRTYARYDSVIQALEQELLLHKINPTSEDKKMLDQFQMKSKRSLERYFFYLLLAKRQNKLQILLPELKQKIRTKIHQKVGHRTSQFLKNLQNCVERYLEAAENLFRAVNVEEAKKAFSHAYLNDQIGQSNQKRPHHNKIKGINKCMQIYKIIMKTDIASAQTPKTNVIDYEKPNNQIKHSEKKNNQAENQAEAEKKMKQNEHIKNNKKKETKSQQDQSFSANQSQLLQNPNQKKKKVGVKNKKQDDRDIQKYAKFDIVSESSLEFLKIHKLQKNIPEICKKLSQRSLHFFFVILALIQKQKKDAQFLVHLQNNYERKVQKRYSQRSEYFRQRLHQSFFNLIQATRALFQGQLQEALDIAYEVKGDKKTHPAKASQQKKCRQIYEAIVAAYEGTGTDSKLRLELLIQNDKGHRSQLIKQIKCPSLKSLIEMQSMQIKQEQMIKNPEGNQKLIQQLRKEAGQLIDGGCKIEQQMESHKKILKVEGNEKQLKRELTNVIIPIPQRLSQVYSAPQIN